MHRVPLAQREYLDVRVVGKTPRPAETTTRHCQLGGEGHTFGADSESEFLGLQLWASTPVASPAALRHHPRQEPRALTRMRGSVRGDWRKPVPYRDALKAGPNALRYPHWQILSTGEVVAGIEDVLRRFDGDAWAAYRLLKEMVPDGSDRHFYELLRDGDTATVLAHIDGNLEGAVT